MKSHLHIITGYKRLPRIFSEGAVFCAFDTETTGLGSQKERIIEISAVKFNKDGIIEKFNSLINPHRHIPQLITDITHITDSMVENAPDEAEVLSDFLKFVGESILVAHNAQFDIRFVNAFLERNGKEPLPNLAVDTLRMSRILFPELEHWKLQFLAEKFSIEVNVAHRALDDARVCMELFLILLEEQKKAKTSKKQNEFSF